MIVKVDLITGPSAAILVGSLDASSMAAGGDATRVMNFGPYQYVVTIPCLVANPRILIISKLYFSVIENPSGLFIPSGKHPNYGLDGMMPSSDPTQPFKFYLALQDSASKNFQSYYLLVDPCLHYLNNNCEMCSAGYWLVTTQVPLRCVDSTTFVSRAGMLNTTYELRACTDFCEDCRYDYKTCKSCDLGWYLSSLNVIGNQCWLNTQIPDQFGIDLST